MGKLVDVIIRRGNKPGDNKKAAAMIQAGRAVIGNPTADVAYYLGKAPPPEGDHWFYLVESRRGVLGYVAVGMGQSTRIPSHHIVAMSIAAGIPAEVAQDLMALLLQFTCTVFFELNEGRGYVTVDMLEQNLEARAAVEFIGLEHISTRRTGKNGKGGIARYAALPCCCPAHDPPDED